MNSKAEIIYNLIENEYGSRNLWISDLAIKLGISKYKANILTLEAGYERGKKIKSNNIQQFKNNLKVTSIIKDIKDDLLDAL